MTIQHGTAHTSYSKPPGHDLRDTAVGGAIRHGSPEAVTRFRQILAARDVGQQEVGLASPPATEEKPMETTTVAAATPANDGAAERGRSRAVRRKTRPQAQKKYTDDLLRQVHAEYWSGLDTISATARRWNISQSTLSDRWRALDLPVATGANRFARRLS